MAVDDWVREAHGLRLHRNLTLISPEGEYVPDGIAAPKGAFAGRDWHSKPEADRAKRAGTEPDILVITADLSHLPALVGERQGVAVEHVEEIRKRLGKA